MCLHEVLCVWFLQSLAPGQFPNPRLRLTPLGQPGPVTAAREKELQLKPGSSFLSSPLPTHAPAFLFYTTSFFPSLIVCLPTLPELFKLNADIFSLFSSPFTKPHFYIKLVNWTVWLFLTWFTLQDTVWVLGRLDSYPLSRKQSVNATKKKHRRQNIVQLVPQPQKDYFTEFSVRFRVCC